MFVLAEMKNTVRITPNKFDVSLHDAVSNYIKKVLLGKVVKDVGFCIALFDITKLEKAFILPGDGSAHTTVHFRIVVFRPFEEEILQGKVARCTKEGVRVTMNFFDNILIPSSYLQQPCRFDEEENLWVWEYETADGKHDMFMDIGEEIRFRVLRNTFQETKPADIAPSEEKKSEESTSTPPYIVTASISEPGLGLLSWWS